MNFKIAATFLFLMAAFGCFAQSTNTKHSNTVNGVAIEGYDPVAYFIEGKAVKGIKSISTSVSGVTYYFSKEEYKKMFLKEPSKYAPQYGGWCAFAIGAKGEKVEVNPKTFTIYNGKLYLFYNAYFTNTLTQWKKNETNLMKQADRNWSNIIN
jgi:YHS domain-containing protein